MIFGTTSMPFREQSTHNAVKLYTQSPLTLQRTPTMLLQNCSRYLMRLSVEGCVENMLAKKLLMPPSLRAAWMM